ncbi:hypothetical protein MBLNU457_2083t1 [Dothideomycetes sp. NU457]
MELLSAPPFNLPKTFRAVDDAIDKNADIADSVLAVALDTYGIDPNADDWKGAATPADMDKVRSTIRQLFRDWSAEGAEERRVTFEPMLAALNRASASLPPSKRCRLNVLVPGAGLGRLAFEVCRSGYTVEANEISYHQLMVSNWALNHQPVPERFELYPWALNFSNHLSRANQLQKVMVPDVAPGAELNSSSEELEAEIHAFERMSFSSGDFCVFYKSEEYKEAFDAVLTCFFIDTAPNLIAYIETVANCLVSGGAWINMGPLLWHFENGGNSKPGDEETGKEGPDVADKGIAEAGSFELSQDEVVHLIERFGFEFAHHDTQSYEAGYIQDTKSMLQNTYRPSFWVARKIAQ